jgi:hypothetical protein
MPPRKAAPSGSYIAVQSGVCEIKGEPFVFVKGATLVREGHPLLAAVPDYFEPVTEHLHHDHELEAATATPGEKRA